MGDYAAAPELYDLLYSAEKDYRAEADLLASVIRDASPHARRVLDVACGTGEHARWLTALGFEVDGVDLEPAFIEMARSKCPGGRFEVDDMTTLDLGRTYDAVTCLFSSIGYVRTLDRLNHTVAGMARHLEPDGVLLVDPWFEPGQLTHGWVTSLSAGSEELQVCRMSRTLVQATVSTLEFEYLIGRPEGLERRSETHRLGLFTQQEMEDAFRDAGLSVSRLPEALRTRGIYVGRR